MRIAIALAGKIPAAGQTDPRQKMALSGDAELFTVAAHLLRRNFVLPARAAGHEVRLFVHSWDYRWSVQIVDELQPDGFRCEPFAVSAANLTDNGWTKRKVALPLATALLSKYVSRQRSLLLVQQFERAYARRFDVVFLLRLDGCACTPFDVLPLPPGITLMVSGKTDEPRSFWDGARPGISDYLEKGTSAGLMRYYTLLVDRFVLWSNMGDGGSHVTPGLAISRGLRRWRANISLRNDQGYRWYGPALMTEQTAAFLSGRNSSRLQRDHLAGVEPLGSGSAHALGVLTNYGHIVRCVDSRYRNFLACVNQSSDPSALEACTALQCQ